ncbi:MAG: uroporphyrinogen decarboxylase family protein [Thermodesulfobacteriota bacterium]
MTNRERLLAILEGRSPDRIPWIPRLGIWYNAHRRLGSLPDRFKGMTLREVERTLRLGTPARGARVFRTEYRNMDVIVRDEGRNTITEYITPKGTVRTVKSVSEEQARLGFETKIITEYPLKSVEDYDVWMYVVENTVFVPTYEEYEAFDREIGEDGLPMVDAGDCPFHQWLNTLAGYDSGYIHLIVEFRDRVEALLKLMTEKDREMWKIVAESPSKLILHGQHLSTQLTPPNYFELYITPYYQEFSKLLHANGKSLTMHADNDTSRILPHLKAAGYDMLECFATAPMAKVTLQEAREVLGTSVIIWGGVPSVLLEEYFPEEEFETYMVDVFRSVAPGDAFILGISDNAMPNSIISRVERISGMVEEYGHYPISLDAQQASPREKG